MQAILCSGHGDVSVLSLGEADLPALRTGQVRIRVRASGVNRADLLQRAGKYPPPAGESEILGLEVAGDVLETAADVTTWKPGDRVMALVAGGGYAEEVCVDAGLVMPLPARLSYRQGAAIPEAFITAYLNLFLLGDAQPGMSALIHAGASGVGTAALQLLRLSGVRTFATVGSDDKAQLVTQLGARAVRYRTEDFGAIIRDELGGSGVDLILDPVGASYLAGNVKSLGLEGRLVLIATMSGREGTLDLGLVLAKRLQIIGSTLRSLPLERKRRIIDGFQEQFLGAFEARRLQPVIDQVYPAADVRSAHARMEANQNLGKILLQWMPD